jgi:signal transduction histidine kinase
MSLLELEQPPHTPGAATAQRVEELGRIILAYSEVTEKLQQSHDQLNATVRNLQNELGEKNRLLERKNRLAALGEMAAGVAHEIRNPLGGIQLYASMLARDLADRPALCELVHKIAGGVRRLESIVSQVLQFSRDIRPNVVETDLADVVQQAVELAAHARALGRIRCELAGPRTMSVRLDPALFGQALLNLILNGIDAMSECAAEPGADANGTLRVEYSTPPAGSEARQFHLTVRDSGPGIRADLLDRIFNPFFTTRGAGTGLGLSIVHRVVEAHDGTITAGNCDGGGARFDIRI